MVADLVFFTAVSFLLLHEMDAIDKKEWQLLFVLRRLPDRGAMRWFVFLHLPLYVGLLALVAAEPSPTIERVQGAVDAFLVVHAALHERLARGGHDAFANAYSRSLILPAAVLGAAHGVWLILG